MTHTETITGTIMTTNTTEIGIDIAVAMITGTVATEVADMEIVMEEIEIIIMMTVTNMMVQRILMAKVEVTPQTSDLEVMEMIGTEIVVPKIKIKVATHFSISIWVHHHKATIIIITIEGQGQDPLVARTIMVEEE